MDMHIVIFIFFVIYFKVFLLLRKFKQFKIPINRISHITLGSKNWHVFYQFIELVIESIESKRYYWDSILQLVDKTVDSIIDNHYIFQIKVFKDP